jgi:hypothetical protein
MKPVQTCCACDDLPPQQCVRYLIACSPSAGEFQERFDCPM